MLERFRGSIDDDILGEVFSATRTGFVGQLLVLVFTGLFFYDHVPATLLVFWLLGHLLNLAWRYQITTKFLEKKEGRLFALYTLSLAFTSLLWAMLALFMTWMPPEYRYLPYGLVIALTFGATMSIGPVTPLFLLFVLPMNLTMMAALFTYADPHAAAAALFLPVSLFFAAKAARMHLMDYTVLVTRERHAKMLKEYFEHRAGHDDLTGIPNRNRFFALFKMRLEEAKRAGRPLALLFIDLNRFKQINDSHGHSTGDIVLETVGKRLVRSLRKDDIPARFAGDEFVILVENIGSEKDLAALAQKIHDAVSAPIAAAGVTLEVFPSIGIARFPQDGHTVDELFRAADEAMYCSKREGRPYAFHRR